MKSNYQEQELSSVQLRRIQDYCLGLLDSEEMYALEKEALADPFLQDALDGYQISSGVHDVKISLLQKRLADRVQSQKTIKNDLYFSTHRLAIASVAAVLFLLGFLLYWMKQDLNTSKDTEKQVEVALHSTAFDWSIEPESNGVSSSLIPVNGWKSYSDYLNRYQDNIGSVFTEKNPMASNTITIQLYLEADRHGKINLIRYRNEIDRDIQLKLNRLIKEGPAWKGKSGEASIVIKINKD